VLRFTFGQSALTWGDARRPAVLIGYASKIGEAGGGSDEGNLRRDRVTAGLFEDAAGA
jgi:hypothetical protein